MATAVDRLPEDLLERIFDAAWPQPSQVQLLAGEIALLDARTRSYISIGKVCRRWRRTSRRLLYQHILIDDEERAKQLLATLREDEDLQAHVESVSVTQLRIQARVRAQWIEHRQSADEAINDEWRTSREIKLARKLGPIVWSIVQLCKMSLRQVASETDELLEWPLNSVPRGIDHVRRLIVETGNLAFVIETAGAMGPDFDTLVLAHNTHGYQTSETVVFARRMYIGGAGSHNPMPNMIDVDCDLPPDSMDAVIAYYRGMSKATLDMWRAHALAAHASGGAFLFRQEMTEAQFSYNFEVQMGQWLPTVSHITLVSKPGGTARQLVLNRLRSGRLPAPAHRLRRLTICEVGGGYDEGIDELRAAGHARGVEIRVRFDAPERLSLYE